MALKGIYFSSPKLQMQYNAATQYKANGIMNNAFEHPERPHTPSFVGSYDSQPAAASYVYHEEAPAKDPYGYDRDTPATASYVYHEEAPAKGPYGYDRDTPATASYVYGRDMPRRATTLSTSASTVGFLPPKKKKHRNRCGKSCVLLVLLACFIILSVVMIVLYLTRPFKTGQESANNNIHGSNQPTTKAPTPEATQCLAIPKPVAFSSLPKRLQTELSSLESYIERQVESHQPTAVTANIVYMDKVIWQAQFGVMNNSVVNKRKPTANTVFPLASVSKVLTVVMLYKLLNEGLVRSINDPVANYQTDFFVKNPFNNEPITLRELASHRSGLQREAPCFPDTKTNLCPFTHNQMIQRLKNLTLLREPGKQPQYSNLGFALLGQVLGERFGNGRGFKGWMKDNMLTTLGMTDTTFTLDQSIKQRIPVGYTSKTEFSDVLEWGWLNPTGGAFSTAADLAKLEIALFREESNRYLSQPLTDALFAPGYILPNGKDAVGTPWEMQIVDDLLIRTKRGYVYGYDSLMEILPEMKLAFNLLCTNCNSFTGKVERTFTNKFLTTFEEVLRTTVQQKIVDPPDMKPYIGVFTVEGLAPIKSLEAKVKDGHIHLFVNRVLDYFILNYTDPLTFKVIVSPSLPCSRIFGLGIDNDLVVYDSPSQVDGLSDKFLMFGAHPSGRTFFYRDRNAKTA